MTTTENQRQQYLAKAAAFIDGGAASVNSLDRDIESSGDQPQTEMILGRLKFASYAYTTLVATNETWSDCPKRRQLRG